MGVDGELQRLREENARLQAELEARDARFEQAFVRNPAVKLMIDPETGRIVEANPAAAAFYGYDRAQLCELSITDLNQLPVELVQREMERARAEHRTYFEFKHRLSSGEVRDVQVYSVPVQVGGQTLLYSIICDISLRKQLAQQLQHLQRMEALGRLAGGVAHDFNNLLLAINMIVARTRRRAADPPAVTNSLDDLSTLVDRGSGLTRQLLAFCRRQVLDGVLLDTVELVRRGETFMRQAIGERCTLELVLPDGPLMVVADPTQLEQVLLNLAVNARDALPGGGPVRVEVAAYEGSGEPLAGPCVALLVSDSGMGMNPTVRQQAFEPFFTTKDAGVGTGLGLSTVYGIVTQTGGHVELDSAPGVGTTVRVLLPRSIRTPAHVAEAPGPASRSVGGTERLLVVDDQPAVLESVALLLRDQGYQVTAVADGREAATCIRDGLEALDLLITDVVMPHLSGLELGRIAQEAGLRVLFMSGNVDSPAIQDELAGAGGSFLQKPFSAAVLLEKVRGLLDGAPRAGGGPAQATGA